MTWLSTDQGVSLQYDERDLEIGDEVYNNYGAKEACIIIENDEISVISPTVLIIKISTGRRAPPMLRIRGWGLVLPYSPGWLCRYPCYRDSFSFSKKSFTQIEHYFDSFWIMSYHVED